MKSPASIDFGEAAGPRPLDEDLAGARRTVDFLDHDALLRCFFAEAFNSRLLRRLRIRCHTQGAYRPTPTYVSPPTTCLALPWRQCERQDTERSPVSVGLRFAPILGTVSVDDR